MNVCETAMDSPEGRAEIKERLHKEYGDRLKALRNVYEGCFGRPAMEILNKAKQIGADLDHHGPPFQGRRSGKSVSRLHRGPGFGQRTVSDHEKASIVTSICVAD